MADILKPTVDSTIFDQDGLTAADVNDDHELAVHDAEVINALATQSSRTRWQQAVIDGKAFFTINPLVTIAGQLETDFLLLRNPTASGKTVYFEDIIYTYTKGSGASVIRIYRQPTVTSVGTTQAVQKVDLNGIPSTITLAYYVPTISARGTLYRVFSQDATASFIRFADLGMVMEESNDILLTIQPAANNTDHSITASWMEE
jgi:hypothetical protein